MTAAFFVITDVIFGGVIAIVWTTSISLILFALRYGLALKRKMDEGDRSFARRMVICSGASDLPKEKFR